MLTSFLAAEVRRLLAEGKLSQRKIARQLAISRGSVQRIAQGKWREPLPEPDEEPQGPKGRCPQCRAMVHLPCRACRVRRRQLVRPFLAIEPCEPLGLDLRPEHQRRYEQIRAARGNDE